MANLIPYPYAEGSTTKNGVTFTVNDRTIKAVGTATTGFDFNIFLEDTMPTITLEPDTNYRLSGCPSGGSASGYYLWAVWKTSSGTKGTLGTDTGSGVTFTGHASSDRTGVYFHISSGQTVNLSFTPVLEETTPDGWIEPVTDRLNGQTRMTYIDMNRITGNLVFLYNFIVSQGVTPTGSPYSKTDWVQNDIITTAQWTELLACLTNVCNAVGYEPQVAPTSAMTYTNINNVETIEQTVLNIAETIDEMVRLNHWIGDPYFAKDPINAGGIYE